MIDYEKALNDAHEAARIAVEAEEAREPENMNMLDCGFAWVTISGNDPLARHCRKQIKNSKALRVIERRYGDKSYTKGWQWWKPGNFNGQSIRIHEAGAKAFRDKLAEYGIRADMGSRLD